jgi:hypothetical protein
MKEIDFIPSWYHENRQRRNWYFRRYVTILLVTGIWMIGNLIAGGIISRAYADLDSLRSSYEQGLKKVELARKLESRLLTLTRQSRMLQHLRPRTEISPILAELSSCIGDRVVLTDVSLVQTPLEGAESSRPAGAVAVQIKNGPDRGESMLKSDTVMKVTLSGIAADGAEVASLISRLEESDYFTRVVPVYSKNQMRFNTTVTEFEIHCVVADFRTTE